MRKFYGVFIIIPLYGDSSIIELTEQEIKLIGRGVICQPFQQTYTYRVIECKLKETENLIIAVAWIEPICDREKSVLKMQLENASPETKTKYRIK